MSARHILSNRREHCSFEFTNDGIGYRAGVGKFPNGDIAEIFLDCEKRGSAAETSARDCAVMASLCLQHGVTIDALRHSLVKLADGSGAGPLGRALDIIGATA